ncbi:hypothetical protein C8J27_101275 [Rhodobacter aestuarii]|uniref:Uncharacterized protein n=1 Tax=Rhodobacter aestuarii TaxID=453582 RepID=A0A1N7J5B4_9RHOB|nr:MULTISPECIES: hypothetical protein [Rhodobacter]PTV97165.1 hypothetical protein C8J27_101275 [Rhodobacter aestuarii]SIS44520.1 hypothetical protein SAMN05421580_101367 [Rhodobacter aestuarii]SOC21901.1 hypothetical protein SAMN05877809_1199 [Rhodobacter sp. JA431]
MEFRIIAVVLSFLGLMCLQLADSGTFGTGSLARSFDRPAFVDLSGHQVGRSNFSPLALPRPSRLDFDAGKKFFGLD